MLFHTTIFIFVLLNLTCGFVLDKRGKNELEWPFEYLFKEEISDVETSEKETNNCVILVYALQGESLNFSYGGMALKCIHNKEQLNNYPKDLFAGNLEYSFAQLRKRYRVLLHGDSLPCNDSAKNSTEGSPLILTSYIESGELEKARNLSKVDPTFFAGVNSHAAYFTVNKTKKWHLFFWYFPAQGVPLESTPLLIWLNGGPGCSSLTGLFVEIGPLQFKNGKVEQMPITWGSNYSLLFIDSPVGTGFSYTEDPKQYATNEDMVGESLLNFLQQFLQVFYELRSAPLFLTGESYAGKYIPAFGHYIHKNNKNNGSMPINLKGLAIGDGWTDPPTLLHYAEWALQVGLVDPEVSEEIHKIEEAARRCWDEHNATCFSQYGRKAYRVLKDVAPLYSFNYINDTRPAKEHVKLLNKPEIQEAIHVKSQPYRSCSMTPYDYLMDDIYRSAKPWLEELLEHYGVMCYSGQLDMIVAYALSVHTYQSLKWSGQQGYLNATREPIYNEDDYLVNSFIKASGNFMDVMVRSAGHLVPTDQPVAAKQIINMFIKKFK